MALKGSYRSKYEEIDKSGYIVPTSDETGAIVINSPKGWKVPKLAQNENDIFNRYGYPSATYPELFEALAFIKTAPLWISSAVHADARWGGVHVTSGAVTAFSAGNTDPDNYVYTADKTLGTYSLLGSANGINKVFSGTLDHIPVDSGSLVLKVAGTAKTATEESGVITGADVTAGTLVLATGVLNVTFTNAPTSGAIVSAEWGYDSNVSTSVSHSFFAASPYTDDLSVKIENVSGSKFKMTLYQSYLGTNVYLTEYNYSLIREKDGYGANLYILDVFDKNDFLVAKLNSSYAYSTPVLTATTVALDGGKRGTSPTTANYSTSWDYFKKPNKYAAKILMDPNGNNITDINTIITSYQYYSFGIATIPMGNDAGEAVTYRSGLGTDSNLVALYTNWRKIYDQYNDSFAWISDIGSVGQKLALMADVYDGMSPAGIDEDGHGGQISNWRTIEMENDYTDTELQNLDEAQINPIIFDDQYGVMIYGDRTLQVSASDHSFILTRRLDNYVIEKIVKQVLRLKEFKLNTASTRAQAKAMVETLLDPILAKGLIREARVICDATNNTDTVLTNRQFIIDIVKKSTTNNQSCRLRITSVAQNAVIAEIIPV